MTPHEKQRRGESDEWYTPPEVFQALGLSFDLDPCSPPDPADTHVPAARRLTIDDNGLAAQWEGLVWLNPPYGPQVESWIRKLRYHGRGIALIPARTDTAWFHREARHASALLLMRGRIRFLRPGGVPGTSPGFPSLLLAYGGIAHAALIRSNLGLVVVP